MSATTRQPLMFAVKARRTHRANCKRLTGAPERLTAREAIVFGYPTALCCKPDVSMEWKATEGTLRRENAALSNRIPGDDHDEDVVAAEVAAEAPFGVTHVTLVPEKAPRKPRKTTAPVEAAPAPAKPRDGGPAAGKPEDKGRKIVRAGTHRPAYLSRTPRADGAAGYVAYSWDLDGVSIEWTWGEGYRIAGQPVDGLRTLTQACDVAAAGPQ